MHMVTLFDAKTHLSRLVESLVEGKEDRIVISRRGKPVVTLTALRKADTSKRVGLARGRFNVPDDIDRSNESIATLFTGSRSRS